MDKLLKKKRSARFMPQLLLHLANHSSWSGKLSDLPKSYQSNPYNLTAKVTSRGGIRASITFNVKHDTCTILKLNPTT